MKNEDVTAQILAAWDEIQTDEEKAQAEETPDEETADEPVVEPADVPDGTEEDEEADDGEDEEEGEDEETEETEEGEDEEPTVTAYQTDDPEILAFLAKYDGNVDQALRATVELQRVLGRQGSEKAALAEQVNELQAQLIQAQAFQSGASFLTPEQAQWVEEAAGSGNPGLYVRRAVEEGEFELARAVAREWAREDPYEATRAGQVIDSFEMSANTPVAQPVDTGVLLDVLAENFPEMRAYEPQMVGVLNQLGPNHPLVIDARTGDVQTAARAIVSIYEIARASSASVRSAKDNLKRKNRKEADDVREDAVVSSASSSASAGETPRRSRLLMPGLTEEQFEQAFAQQ